MDGVGEGDAGVIARAFESTEVAAQHLHLAELSALDGLTQPLRRRVEPENVPNLQNPLRAIGQLRELASFRGNERDWFFDEDNDVG